MKIDMDDFIQWFEESEWDLLPPHNRPLKLIDSKPIILVFNDYLKYVNRNTMITSIIQEIIENHDFSTSDEIFAQEILDGIYSYLK